MKTRKTNKAKRIPKSCRNHGSCDWCKGNRTFQSLRENARAEEQIASLTQDTDNEIEDYMIYEECLAAFDMEYRREN